MGGGKETPRQKMIGMMYLVLMAMLALNVSKSIIDAFVAIEENIQISSQNEHARGLEKLMELEEKYQSGDTPEIKAKAKKLLDYIALIDKETAKQIQYLDALKMEILVEIKEEPAKLKPGAESIIMVGYDKNYPLKPMRMNLAHVTNKDKYDEGMRIFGIAKNMKAPEAYACKSPEAKGAKGGIELWNQMNDFRGKVCQLLVESSSSDTVKYKFVDPKVYAFKDLTDLQKKVKDGLKKSKISGDDVQDVEKIYKSLTKNEKLEDELEPGGVHWLAKTFNHAPSVAAIASLSALQKEILTARADAVSLIRSRLGGGEYSFNKIRGLAYAESSVLNPGDQFEVTVMMAAFDTDKQPIVKPNNGTVTSVANGEAKLKMTAPASGEMIIKGTVGVANKRGEIKEMTYETKIQVATKAGSVGLPEVSVLYTDWNNKVIATASGVIQTDINISGPARKSGKGKYKGQDCFFVTCNQIGKVKITPTGKDSKGKMVSFQPFEFNVKQFPKPKVLTESISKTRGGFLNVGFGPEYNFDGIGYTILSGEFGGQKFMGETITSAISSKFRSGETVGLFLNIKRKDNGKTTAIKGAVTII